MAKVVTFGELMLRLSPPGHERLLQSPGLQATFGGAEANVAVALAQFGLESWYVTRLPAHAIGEAAMHALRALGVRTDLIVRGGSRLGIYFTEPGASQRPSVVIYDRAGSAVSEMEPDMVDWPRVFDGATWFHWTGITPALGPRAAACIERAVEAARAAGVTISVDLNYRAKLWTERRAQEVMRPLMPSVDLLVANEEDLQTVLGLEVAGTSVTSGVLNLDPYRDVARRVVSEFGVSQVAITLRESESASVNGWRALLLDASGRLHESQRYTIQVVDRLGAGDSFTAGLIYGLTTGRAPEAALRFAVAASALKHSIPGDFNRITVGEVDRLAGGDASGRVQR
jgi:2-dehydro-3-deoxygluconokinase